MSVRRARARAILQALASVPVLGLFGAIIDHARRW